MRLNALHPSDNPMEELLFCFGGDDGGGGGGGDSADDADSMDSGYDTSTVGMGTNTDSNFGGGNDNDNDGIPNSIDATPNGGSGTSYSPPSSTPSFGTSSGTANVVDAYNDAVASIAAGTDVFGAGGATGGGGSPVSAPSPVGTGTVLAPTGAPVGTGTVLAPTVAPAAIQAPVPTMAPTFAPTLLNQPLTVGGKVAVMPYESYQRSPQQMFGYGGLTASPYSPDAISFQGGAPAATVDPLTGRSIMQFDVGRSPVPAGTPDDRNFLEKAIAGVGSLFDSQEQRAGVFDPVTGTFERFDGQTTLQKTSDNVLGDVFGNAIAGAMGITPFVGRLDTKEYTPLAGGEPLQYSTSQGGLLSGMIGENLIPYSELEARQAQMGGDGDGGQRAPLIVPEQTPEEEREQSAFPQFTPREYKYQPFTSKFYTIPSRFTKPYGLLG